VLRALSLVYMLSPLPRRSSWDPLCSITQPYQSSPIGESGRPAHRPFRGLLSVHSRYGLHTRTVTVFRDSFTEGFNCFVTSTVAPVASGWSISPGGILTHWKAPPCHGAPPKQPLTVCSSIRKLSSAAKGNNTVAARSIYLSISKSNNVALGDAR